MSLIHISKQLAVAGVRHEIVLAGSGMSNDQFDCLAEVANSHPMLGKLISRFGKKAVDALSNEKLFTTDEDGETVLTKKGAQTLKTEMTSRQANVRSARNKGYKQATAAEAKDPEAPPYSRKRNLSSLNNKRLAKVLGLLCVCNNKSLGLKGVIESAKDMNVKEAQELLLKFQAQADTNNEALRDINDILKAFFGHRNGFFGLIATNISEAIQGKAIKDNPYAVVKEQLTMYGNAIKYVDGYVNRVFAEAKKRGISDTQLHAMARSK